jgi:hypothetical protein
MTKATAKKWCIKKWEWIAENWNKARNWANNYASMELAIPQLIKFTAHCAYCEIYEPNSDDGCPKCPLQKKLGIKYCCFNENSPFHKWKRNPTKRNARAMLEAIKKS